MRRLVGRSWWLGCVRCRDVNQPFLVWGGTSSWIQWLSIVNLYSGSSQKLKLRLRTTGTHLNPVQVCGVHDGQPFASFAYSFIVLWRRRWRQSWLNGSSGAAQGGSGTEMLNLHSPGCFLMYGRMDASPRRRPGRVCGGVLFNNIVGPFKWMDGKDLCLCNRR